MTRYIAPNAATTCLQFRIGTGFTDEQRRHPPPIGSRITYSYHNLTARGIPRFARFLRVRPPD